MLARQRDATNAAEDDAVQFVHDDLQSKAVSTTSSTASGQARIARTCLAVTEDRRADRNLVEKPTLLIHHPWKGAAIGLDR
ncbi:hypothetical protein D3C84_1150280 [compost metagenome]